MHQSTGSMPTLYKRVLLSQALARGACTGSMLSKNRPKSTPVIQFTWFTYIVRNIHISCPLGTCRPDEDGGGVGGTVLV